MLEYENRIGSAQSACPGHVGRRHSARRWPRERYNKGLSDVCSSALGGRVLHVRCCRNAVAHGPFCGELLAFHQQINATRRPFRPRRVGLARPSTRRPDLVSDVVVLCDRLIISCPSTIASPRAGPVKRLRSGCPMISQTCTESERF